LVLGCGPGRECIALSSRGFDVTGLDREEGMLVQARNLAAREISKVRFVAGEATSFDLGGERFDAVVAFSGLYNMILPRERRLDLLRSASRHLSPRGRVLLTFLSDYVAPGSPPPSRRTTFLQAINPTHEPGDLYLLNEAVHNFPHPDLLAGEAREAGFEVADIWRDQRAYDRTRGQVRGYAVLVAAQPVWQ
jgi:ubiquinone/menaquinone biosynthesis C-methylase UbiE